MEIDELGNEREADAGTLERAGSRSLDPMEPFEEVHLLARGDTDTGITNRELDGLPISCEADRNTSVERELQGIRQQVRHDLRPHLPVHRHLGSDGVALHAELQVGPFDGGA